jgi:hypothetical protein
MVQATFDKINKEIPVSVQDVLFCCHDNFKTLRAVPLGTALFFIFTGLFTHPIQPINKQNRIQGMFTHPVHAGLIISSQKQKGIPKSMTQLGETLLGARVYSLPLLVSPRCLGVTASDSPDYFSFVLTIGEKKSILTTFYYSITLVFLYRVICTTYSITNYYTLITIV